MLDNTETISLIKRAQGGDEEAKNLLIQHNFPLVKSIIKRFKTSHVEYEDLYQIGCVGFIKAINNFDTSFDVKFSTYAVPMVIGEIKRFLRDDGFIKVSRSVKMQNIYITRFIEEYTLKNAMPPTLKQIAEKFSIDEEELVFIMDSAKMPISIYTPFENEKSGLLLIDRFKAFDETENVMTKIMLKEALKTLPERERKIVLLRYFRDKTQSEIAKELQISQVQVSRLENKVLETLKEKLS
ncbi:MAG: SigB/SigF/SigG family RNA polymerase sigma factor, partial [Clostridia bacterium]|nr:SigB/SigF/SigG family RNA polymerase sigma factor [Clostridia bacterium]